MINSTERRKRRMNRAREALLDVLGDQELTLAQIDELLKKHHPDVTLTLHHVITSLNKDGLVYGKSFYFPELKNQRHVYRKRPWVDPLPKCQFSTRLANFMGITDKIPLANFMGITDKIPPEGTAPKQSTLMDIQRSHKLPRRNVVSVQSYMSSVFYS